MTIYLNHSSFYQTFDDFKYCSEKEREEIENHLSLFKSYPTEEIDKSRLFNYVQKQALDFKNGSPNSLLVLFHLYYRYIIKTAWELYKKYGYSYCPRYLFSDVRQDAFLLFVTLIENYDETRSKFAYYIKYVFRKKMYRIMMKQLRYLQQTSVRITGENTIDNMHGGHGNRDTFMEMIIQQNIVNELQKLLNEIKTKSKSETVKKVCDNVIEGQFSIPELAETCNVSYHAVYQVFENIQITIANYINHSKYSDYVATMKSTDTWLLSKKDRRVKYNYIFNHACGACGHKFKSSDSLSTKKHPCPKCNNLITISKRFYAKFSYYNLENIDTDRSYEYRDL